MCEENDTNLPFMFFIIDTCLSQQEFDALKEAIYSTIETIENMYVGLISISHHVHLHSLDSGFMSETIVSGQKEYT